MPKFLENDLRRAGRKKGFTGEKLEHYVYGGMNNLGAMHGSKETAKGREMEEKHEDDMKKMGNMGHTEPMREMRIEIHRGPKNKLTGFTVHHHMMPKPTKSAAFSENTTHSHPFSADEHEQMMDHVSEHLGAQAGAVTPKEAPGGANAAEEEQEEGE